jgi:Fe2+ transport system protein B
MNDYENKEIGWIKLYRSLKQKDFFMDGDYLKLWIYLLLTVNRKKAMVDGIVINPGQTKTGRKMLATNVNLNESKIERILTYFESEQQIEQQKTNKYRVISILNWKQYQQDEQQNEQQPTTEQQQKTQTRSYKKENKEKNIIEGRSEKFQKLFEDFREMRKKIKKPMTLKAEELLLSKLSGEIESVQIAMLEQSIVNGWSSVYPIKEEKAKAPYVAIIGERK